MRRIVKVLAAVVFVLAIAVAVLPWWWGAALRMVGPTYGLEFGNYDRVGYERWSLTEVTWNGSPGRFTAQRIELPHPLLLALHGGDAGTLQIADWRWQNAVSSNEQAAEDQDGMGWSDSMLVVQELMSWVPKRVPLIEASGGTVHAGVSELAISRLSWDPESIQVSFEHLILRETDWSGAMRWDSENARMSGRVESVDGNAQFTATAEQAQLEGNWWQQPVVGSVTFGQKGWLPTQAELAASNWKLTGAQVGLAGRYEMVNGTAVAIWEQDRFNLSVTAEGEPVAGLKLPNLKITAKAHGGLNRLVIDTFEANAPGLQAHLSEAVTIGRHDLSEAWNTPATFSVEMNLATLSQNKGSGLLKGRVDLIPVQDFWPQLDAQLEADSLHWKDWPEVSGGIAASFDGKNIQVGRLKFSADDDSQLEISGDWNLASRMAKDVVVKGKIARRWLARWLPEELVFSEIQLSGTAHGVWPKLKHQGTLSAEGLTYEKINPSNWKMDWEGIGLLVKSTLKGNSGKSHLTIVSSTTETGVELDDFILQRADGAELKLVKPTVLTLKPDFNLQTLQLEGPDDSVSITAGSAWRWQVQGSRLEQAWWDDWVTLPGPSWYVESVLVDGVAHEGKWEGQITTQAAVAIGENRSAQITLAMIFDAEGLRIDQGSISEGELPILNITGQAPFWLTLGSDGSQWRFDADGLLSAEISSASNPAFWQQVNLALGVEVREPVILGTLSGSWSKPEGEVSIGADLVRVNAELHGAQWPELRLLKARLIGGSDGLKLEELTARISGQKVHASGRLPWNRDKWVRLRDDPWSYLREAGEGHIEIPDADLSAWATLAPTVLAPLGRLQLSLDVSPGGKVDGSLKLQDAATRPIGPLGAMQDITAEVRFEDTRVVIKSVEAQIGGRPVELKGEANWLESGQPKFDFTLRGQNLPFVRQTGLLLRGDVDLTLQTDDEGITWIRGGVGLRDGLFLVDLQSLRPSRGGGGSGAGRPPYFSVTEDPFANWRLDVAVKGKHFLRMETPVFSGRASADFHLEGNLREPRAIGEATLTEGMVKLPFATFDVSEGWVRLRQSDPYMPRLSVIGTARRMGYDLRMELTGSAVAPNLQFFANPPLTSEEVFLLVMAGQSPQSDVNYTSSQRATKLGAYLGQNLINQFTGNTSGEERLMISLGEKISQGGKDTYRIEYYLNGRWSLVGEYDEFDDYNAGVKWKIFSSQTEKDDDEK